MIEMNEELRRNRQEIVTGLNMFLEENEEDDVSLEELEEEEFDVLEEEGTETISEDGSSKEAHNITRTPQKVSLRSISAMTDEERLMMRIKKFGIISDDKFRNHQELHALDSACQQEKKRKRLERFGLL
ncbi:uncharacterized protein LOC144454542 isoform X3 [Phascolarctos cinereus]